MNSKKLNSIIGISGRICSGKTYLANIIANKLHLPVASFGGYLRDYCEINNILINRKTLQDFGENFIQNDSEQFLIEVIDHFIGDHDSIIIEGIRHKSILKIIKTLSKSSTAIFVDMDQNTRYKRFCSRESYIDSVKTFDQFIMSDNHLVELEIQELKPLCDLVINSEADYNQKLKLLFEKYQ